MPQAKTEGTLGKGLVLFLKVILITFAIFQIIVSFVGMMEPLVQRGIFLGTALGSAFFLEAIEKRQKGSATVIWLFDLLLAAAGYAVCYHIALSSGRLSNFMVELSPVDLSFGLLAVALVLEGARRTIGWFLPLLAIVGLLYYYFGHTYLSGALQPPRVSYLTFVETYYTSTETIFGYMTDMGTRVIAIFIIFGALLLSTGATEVFIKLASLIAGKRYGGQAKVCTVSSALFGTVTGSAVANVMAMGPVTIPTMRRAGYSGSYAAAVEAVSSAGGQIMPPVMGAGAFIMAEILNVPYATVMTAAIIPAMLYFTVLWFSVGMRARRLGIAPMRSEDLPQWRELAVPYDALPMYLPVGALIAMLMMDYTPTLAGAVAVFTLLFTLVALRTLRCLTTNGVRGLPACWKELLAQVIEGLWQGGRAIVMIAVLLACAALVVKVLTATGIGVKVSTLILSFSGGNLVMVLILTAVLAILLGMDVPTTASYILASAIAAPILTRLGVPPLNAHMFVFYFAIMSAITPPVCASVFAAASIAEENFWRVAGHAVVMAIALYLIPFLFIFRTGVLLQGSLTEIFADTMITGLAVIAITSASAGFLAGRIGWPLRLALYVGGGMLFFPSIWTDITGVGILLGCGVLSWLSERRATQLA